MNIRKLSIVISSLVLISALSYSQDIRSTETRVADLLARMPAYDNPLTNRLMADMLSLGEPGINLICSQISPSGTSDDTRSRFAVESLTRYVSQKGKETDKVLWEKICIHYATNQNNFEIQDFFMKQLQNIGGEQSAEAMKIFLGKEKICESALAVISAVGGALAERILAESLKNKDLPCAAGVMNCLALMKSQSAVNEYLIWALKNDINIKASAYNALARSGNSLAYPVLLKAASDALYRWDPTGATASLLVYATTIAENGDLNTMDNICKSVISKADDDQGIQYKTAALSILVRFHGADAMPELITAASHPNPSYRNAAIQMSLEIPGSEIIKKWIKYFPRAIPSAKPEIINMLGLRGDKIALPLISKSLFGRHLIIRMESAAAIVKLDGKDAIPALIKYMRKFDGNADQESAKSALMSLMGNKEIPLLIPVLQKGPAFAQKTVIELLAWNKDNQYFSNVLQYTSSEEGQVQSAAFSALSALAGPANQPDLIRLLVLTENKEYVDDIQKAIAVAAKQVSDPEKRSEQLLKYLVSRNDLDASNLHQLKIKIIPVLSHTAGRDALDYVLSEFKNGNSEIRDICFSAIAGWNDYTASYALFDICASGNKSYAKAAFDAYVRQIKSADLPAEQKLLLFRKIMPYSVNAEMQNQILEEIGYLKTYPSLYFVSNYLDDPNTSAVAAKSAMNIALPSSEPDEGMYGGLVKVILIKSAGKLTGSESEYEKERINKYLTQTPAGEGFMPLFNGRDLTGWQGLVENPVERAKMTAEELAKKQIEADIKAAGNWSVRDACIWFNGVGDNLCSVKEYGDFEMTVDWKISKAGDSGIYLRGSPQVQIWDTAGMESAAQVGSGGLYNNKINPSKPLMIADNPVGDWNTFRILMLGEVVSVWLNGYLVVDRVIMENYWDRNIPIFPKGAIELQAHGTDLAFRDIYIREINDKEYNLTPEERAEGFVSLFNGRNLDNWVGNKVSYIPEEGMIVVKPGDGSGGNLYTQKEYSDFIFRFEFQLSPAANNGLGVRTPTEGDAAYAGMEIQILDNTAEVYNNLKEYQYHGSVYGVIPAIKGYLKPVGEWNYEEVILNGPRVKVILNGTIIVDGDISGPRDNGTMDHNEHPGLKNETGHIGFLGHGSELKFRNIRIKEM